MPVPRALPLFLILGLVAGSQSGNIVRIGDAPPAAIVAWRLFLAALLMAPLAGRHLRELAHFSRKYLLLLFAAGIALALHLLTWVAAVQRTTVANAATFFAINPVITAGLSHVIFGERVAKKLLLSIALGLCGVALMGGTDLNLQPGHLGGNLLAVLCALLFSAYFLLGRQVRERLDNRAYVTALYAIGAVLCFAVLGALGHPLVRYSSRSWLCFVLMALVPTMICHTSLNYALKYLPPGRIATFTLSEPLLAGLVALAAWGEPLTPHLIAGYALISGSVVVAVHEAGTGGRP